MNSDYIMLLIKNWRTLSDRESEVIMGKVGWYGLNYYKLDVEFIEKFKNELRIHSLIVSHIYSEDELLAIVKIYKEDTRLIDAIVDTLWYNYSSKFINKLKMIREMKK